MTTIGFIDNKHESTNISFYLTCIGQIDIDIYNNVTFEAGEKSYYTILAKLMKICFQRKIRYF